MKLLFMDHVEIKHLDPARRRRASPGPAQGREASSPGPDMLDSCMSQKLSIWDLKIDYAEISIILTP